MRPMPREPPVMSAVRPFSEKSWVVSMVRVSPELKEFSGNELSAGGGARASPRCQPGDCVEVSDRLRGLLKLRTSPLSGSTNDSDLASSCKGLLKSSAPSGSSTG
jgi:hypothetical protein